MPHICMYLSESCISCPAPLSGGMILHTRLVLLVPGLRQAWSCPRTAMKGVLVLTHLVPVLLVLPDAPILDPAGMMVQQRSQGPCTTCHL